MWVAIGIVWRILISAPVQATKWDAIIVPGGGLEEDGRPYDFVRARLDAALLHDAETEAYIVLSRGTTHKPPPLDEDMFTSLQFVRQRVVEYFYAGNQAVALDLVDVFEKYPNGQVRDVNKITEQRFPL